MYRSAAVFAWALPMALGLTALTCLGGCQWLAGDRDERDLADPLLVDLPTAQALDYRIQWQQDLGLGDGARVLGVTLVEGGVAVIESGNIVTLIERGTGDVRWRKRVGGRGERLQAPVVIGDHMFVCSSTRAVALRMDSGNIADAFDLEHTASTPPTASGNALMFGTPEGLVFAQQSETGLLLWEYKMAAPVEATPVGLGELVFVADSSGQVAAIDPDNGALSWRTTRPPWGPIETEPAASDDLAYVACKDQKLYAFGKRSPRVVWQYLTENPLTESPTLIGNHLYQRTAERGLVCLDADTGEERWRADLPGVPVQEHRGGLWLAEPGKVHIVRDRKVVRTVDLPKVDMVRLDATRSGLAYLVSKDGRVMRLAPQR